MPNYFAQTNSANVNAANLWYTTPSGTGGAFVSFASLTNADVLYLNGRTNINFNVNTTVSQIRNDVNGSGATAGGSMIVADGVTITASLFGGTATLWAMNTAITCYVVGSLTSSATANAGAITQTNGTLYITGDLYGNVGSGSSGAYSIQGTATGYVTGNLYAPSSGGTALRMDGPACTLTITGNCPAPPSSIPAIQVFTGGTITINGIVYTGANGHTINAASGSAVVLTITKVVGNGYGNGSAGMSVAYAVNGSQLMVCKVAQLEFGDRGAIPVFPFVQFTDLTTNTVQGWIGPGVGVKKTLVDNAATADYPANSNVRLGTVFALGNRTGTCAVPAAGSTALNVPVDNTVGTATLTQANVEAALAAFAGGRLSNVATVATTGQQIADAAP